MHRLRNAVALLRVSGPEWDVETTLTRHGLSAVWWRAGAGERPTNEAGLNLVIADADSGPELAHTAAAWLRHNQRVLPQLVPAGGEGRRHVILAIDETQQAGPGLVFEPTTLAILASAGIELAMTAYVRRHEPKNG
jgi:hypothetical protein